MSRTLSTTSFCKFLLISIGFFAFFCFSPKLVSAATLSRGPNNLGLVGYWNFNEGAGAEAADFSGQGNQGKLTNGPVWTTGRLGKALNFDGTNDFVLVPDANSLDRGTDAITVSAWIKHNATVNNNSKRQIATKYTLFADLEWEFFLLSSAPPVPAIGTAAEGGLAWREQAADQISDNLKLDDDKFHHAVFTRTVTVGFDNTYTLYVDGVQRQSGATPAQSLTGASPIRIGAIDPDETAQYFAGIIDEVRIYNRALSAGDVKALYQSGAAKFSVPTARGLVGYWSFNEGTSTEAGDASGKGNQGKLTNGPTWTNGRIGQALSFDGSDDYVSASINLASTNVITISFWLNWKTFANNDAIAFELATGGNCNFSDDGFYISPNSIGGTFDFALCENTPGRQTIATITRPSSGVWHHYAAVMDRGKIGGDIAPVYVDGVSQSITYTRDDDPQGNFANDILYFMSRVGIDLFGAGQIDEVRVYNRALSADEIKTIYRSGQTKINSSQTDFLKNGLVGHWSFDGKFLSRGKALDTSGLNNDGNLTNGPVPAIGRIGQALSFDAVDDYVDAASATSLDDLGPMTVSAWIRPASQGEGSAGAVAFKGTATDGNGFWRFAVTTTNTLQFTKDFATTDLSRISSNNTLVLGQWQHVALTWDGSATAANADIFINGTETTYQTTTNGAGAENTDAALSLFLGNDSAAGVTFDGLIDEVRIYNRALSAEEVKQLYLLGR